MPVIEVPGARLAYDTAGDPAHPAVVFIHAGVATRAMWDPQFADLSTDHFVIRYDTRGFGESPGEDEEFADRHDVFAVMDAVGIDLATLVGASRGGRISLDALLDIPARVAGLVTVGSTPSGQHDGDATPREREIIAQMEAASEAGDYEELVRIEVAYWDLGPTRDIGDVDPAFLQRAIELNVGAAHWDFAGLDQPLEPAAVSRLGEVGVPALVVVGDHDETDSRAGYDLLLAGIAGAEGFRFADSAHLPSVEHPDRFTARLREFLGKNGL
ncbi:MAG: alpha/beta fold hydrolase [Pseudolysinimonas sp.]